MEFDSAVLRDAAFQLFQSKTIQGRQVRNGRILGFYRTHLAKQIPVFLEKIGKLGPMSTSERTPVRRVSCWVRPEDSS